MRKYFYIGAGGILGAILRYWIKGVHIGYSHENIPLNTFITNVTGSFLLALVLTVAFEVWRFDANIRLGIGTGFLGAYTTFSTLCKETVTLIHQGDYFPALSYIALSAMIGLAAVYFGVVLARESISKIVGKEKGDLGEKTFKETGGAE